MRTIPPYLLNSRAGLAEERAPALCRSPRAVRRSVTESHRGFSMIELVIAVSIIATIALIAIPRLNETRARHRDQNTARVIHRATEFAVAEARRRTATVTVTFNAANELLAIRATLPDAGTTEIPWRGAVAGQQRAGGETVSWLITVDPHGQTTITGMPTGANLTAALSATASAGTGVNRGRP